MLAESRGSTQHTRIVMHYRALLDDLVTRSLSRTAQRDARSATNLRFGADNELKDSAVQKRSSADGD
jgi:hypothetical protein